MIRQKSHEESTEPNRLRSRGPGAGDWGLDRGYASVDSIKSLAKVANASGTFAGPR